VKRTFTLKGRLGLGAIGIALVLAIPMAVSVHSLRRLHRIALELRNGEFAASLLLGRFQEGVDDLRRADDALLFVHDTASVSRMDRELTSLAHLSDSLDAYSLNTSADSVRSALDSLTVLTQKVYALAAGGQGAEAESISSHRVGLYISTLEHTIGTAEHALRVRTSDRVDAATEATARAERVALISLIVSLLLATLIALWLIRSISGPVHNLEVGMQAVEQGDFSFRLRTPPDRDDEFGRLSASYESMVNRLAHLDKLKAEFISIASHELKTPINVIMGYVELMQEGIYGSLTDAQRDVCNTISSQANNLTRLVRRLLDVSRFEAGGGKLECRQFRLQELLDTLKSSFSVLAMQRGVQFHIDQSKNLPEEVRWDEDRMNEVVGNLLANAFKFTPRGGRVELSVWRLDEHVQIRVNDTGAGIPTEQVPRIFQKFYQADNQSKAAIEGTGLGLAIAKEIVEAHQGTIDVESQVGLGTTFTITLPVLADPRRSGAYATAAGEAA
jgi:signal transduction histidine kinase